MSRLISSLIFIVFSALSMKSQSPYDIIVAADGTGNFRSIQQAILSVRDFRPEGRTRIFIKKGIYREKIVSPSWKSNISLIGEDRDSTIIVFSDHALINNMGTARTYTLKVEGEGFQAENLTIQNDARPLAQAVALHIEADKALFRNCRLLGFQDTVYTGKEGCRQAFVDCFIEGTVDFIFGPATAWFENCTIHSLKDSYITAASTPAYSRYGYVFNNCRLTAGADGRKVYLGRPWRPYSAVVFMNCYMDSHIRPQGWDNWRNADNEKTARYYEYHNTGAGADRSKRVGWCRQLNSKEAQILTPEYIFLHGSNSTTTNNWNPVITFDDAVRPFIGRPYTAKTLEKNTTEQLVINLQEVDCTTFVEYVLASQLAMTVADTANNDYRFAVRALRYRNGQINGFTSRLNYFSEWILDNTRKGFITEITRSFAEARPLKKKINFMSRHASSYSSLIAHPEQIDSIRQTERLLNRLSISYIPKANLQQLKGLKKGDLIAITSRIDGLDIQHVGFAYPVNGKIHLLHASSSAKKVLIDPQPLYDYLMAQKTATGIRVIRLNR